MRKKTNKEMRKRVETEVTENLNGKLGSLVEKQ